MSDILAAQSMEDGSKSLSAPDAYPSEIHVSPRRSMGPWLPSGRRLRASGVSRYIQFSSVFRNCLGSYNADARGSRTWLHTPPLP